MNTIGMGLRYWGISVLEEVKKEHLLFGLLVAVLGFSPVILGDREQTASYILIQMLPLILLALLIYLVIIALSCWLFQRFCCAVGIPDFREMGLQIKELTVCQMLGFYYACFALVVLTGVLVLMVVL